MKTDQIYSSLLFSFLLHSLFVFAAVCYMLFFSPHYKTVTFDVSLVSTSENGPPTGAVQKSAEAPAPEQKSVHTTEQPEKVTKKETSDVNERIAALEAKKKIENLARLRKSVDISSKGTQESKVQTSGTSAKGGSDYISMIGARIQNKFLIPESMDKDLLAIISLRISKNGSVTVLGFEKKSGNPLHDRAAIKAINDASPFPPPPSDMEISIRLHP
jgi:TonB family protein